MQSVQRTLRRRLKEAIEKKDFSALIELEPKLDKILRHPNNLILCSDAYKYSHHKFYEEGTTYMGSYLESRGGKFNETVFYGLQIFLKEFLEGVAILPEDVDEAEEYLTGVFGNDKVFDRTKFDYIVEKHGGKLPVRIKAVPEGMSVPVSNVLMFIECTDDNCFWLTNFLETLLLQIWYPITVATLSREVKKIVTRAYRDMTDLPLDIQQMLINFTLNDFGFRGVSSVQSARNGGSAHLVNFDGSDNLAGSIVPIEYYNALRVYGLSIPATEHSVMTLKGEEGEVEMMKRVLTQFPTGMVACVSDSYNIFRACKYYWGGELKEMILSRPSTPGNQLVIRPDSGDPKRTLVEVFNILFEAFGYTVNSKGYKVLPPQVRVIQGDGVNINSIADIIQMLRDEKISIENLVFGMGGKLLQSEIDRDTQKFAFKACRVIVNGIERDVVKHPTEMQADGTITESFKKSKSGNMKLAYCFENSPDGGKLVLTTITSKEEHFDKYEDVMVPVFENGVILNEWTFDDVRERAGIKPFEIENDKLFIKPDVYIN